MVSIIVPVYKSEKTLYSCVESLQKQTEPDIEIILIDDGSPDQCPAMCDELQGKDPKIRVIHKENKGVSSARNRGIQEARGEYLLFVDSDDSVEPDMVEKLLRQIGEADLAVCGYYHHYMGREVEKIPDASAWDGAESFLGLYGQGYLNMPWNKLFRRELAGRFDESISLGEDLLFNLDYLRRAAGGVVIVKEPLYHYIQDDMGNTLSSKKRDDKLDLAKRIWREASEFYEELAGHEDRSGTINARLIQEILDDVESLPFDHNRSRREKLEAIGAYCEDSVFKKVEGNVALTALDYRILYACMQKGWKCPTYVFSILRAWVVRILYGKRGSKFT